MSNEKLWTKNFLIITFENFFVYFTYYVLITIIAVYTAEHFNASPSIAGLSAGIFIIGAIAGRLYGGSSIERIGYKKMLYLSFVFFLLTTLLYFAAGSLLLLIVIRFFHGAAFGMTSTATGTIAAEIIPNSRRGEGTGYYALSMTLATAAGPFLGMILMQYADFTATLIVCAIALSISLVAAFPLNLDYITTASVSKREKKESFWDSFIERKAFPAAFVTAFACFAYSSVISFLSSYTKSIGLMEAGSFFFVAYATAILCSRPLTGYYFDKKGENFIIYPTLLVFAGALIYLAMIQQGYAVLVAGVFMGLGFGNFFASGQALAVKASPNNRKALATSTYFIFADIGSGFGPFILGVLIPIVGYRGLYFCMSGVVIATIILYYLLHGKKNKN